MSKCGCILGCLQQATCESGMCGACDLDWKLNGACRPPDQPSRPEQPHIEVATNKTPDDIERDLENLIGG